MVIAKFAQLPGTLNEFRNETNEIMPPGTIVDVGDRIGIVAAGIAPLSTGAVNMTGIYTMPKGADEIKMGSAVVWNGTAIVPASAAAAESDDAASTISVAAGYAAEDAAAEANAVKVVINA